MANQQTESQYLIMKRFVATSLLASALLGGFCAAATDTFNWRTNQNRVTADIKGGDLPDLLERIASVTGWQVFVEPKTTHNVSAKFKDLPPSDALRLLLGDLNFALLPGTNTTPRLFVFRTTMQKATQRVHAKSDESSAQAKVIPNELIVRLKPGAKIDDLARLLGAKVVGRIDGLNAYRLQFDDAAATEAARGQLAGNADVASVEDNYTINRPETPQAFAGSVPPLQLQLNPPPANGRVLIGLIDTAVQPLGNGLDQFLLKQVSLAGDPQFDPNSPSHGTAMAETMLRVLQLLGNGSSSINIAPYDIYGPSEAANTFILAQAIAEAVNKGANPISMSLGSTGDSPLVRDLIRDGSAKGISFYAAVGNNAAPQMNFPAGDPGATPVTALQRDGQVAPYANQSGHSAIGAAGTVPVPFVGLTFLVSGTSPATAIVAATAGSIMEKGPMSAADANAQLQKNATRTTQPGK